jgi:hypothetical protein
MQNKININIAVDVVKALSDKSLHNNIYMMDNSCQGNQNPGTEALCTFCLPGQTIHWVVYAIDLQTPVVIKSISFINVCEQTEIQIPNNKDNSLFPEDNLDLKTWTGILPCMKPLHKYYYRLELQMGNGINSVMSVDTSALLYPC